ncbi:MAG: hypothetical protein Q9163_002370 [Psora crenata]
MITTGSSSQEHAFNLRSIRTLKLYSRPPTFSPHLPILPRTTPIPLDEPYEVYDQPSQPSQRQQRQPILSPTSQPRPPSSSDSSRTLRRTPRLPPRQVTSSRPIAATKPIGQSPTRQADQAALPALSEHQPSSPSPHTAARILRSSSYWPVRSTRISKRTAEAILYALEAIRGDPEDPLANLQVPISEGQPQRWKPKLFTPNLAEENASMSDLAGGGVSNGRTQNGGGLGPVPVPQAPGGDPGRATPPTEIMARRRAREARRREQERQQREQTETGRKAQEQANAEQDNMAATAGVGTGGERTSYRRSSARTSTGDPTGQPTETGRVPPVDQGSGGSNRGLEPATIPISNGRNQASAAPQDGSATVSQPRTRQRGATLSMGQPRPVQTQPGTNRAASGPALGSMENQASQTRPPSKVGMSQTRLDRSGAAPSVPPQGVPEPKTRSNTSSFPHAFERWEQLSSHWEGLTSFWIRRLEQNQEDLDREPLNQQMARQVTDLSAAGANLFHAVVELQRLRASSERKFQRWFFETRADQERARETQAKLEEQLRSERQARTEIATNSAKYDNEIKAAYAAKAVADVQVREMRRELAISKDEARRAWEELGRREQEERERTKSLRDGQITVVGGLQVVPMAQNPSRQGTLNRPSARDGPTPAAALPVHVDNTSNDPGYTAYEPARSDTDTDPFTEGGRINAELPPLPSSQAHQQTSNTSAAARQAARGAGMANAYPPSSQSPRTTTTTTTTIIPTTYLRYGPEGTLLPSTTQPPASFYQHSGTLLQHNELPTRGPEGDERSFVPSPSPSLSQDEYEMDSNGEVLRDSSGNPVVSRRILGSEDSDEYNVAEQLERERMYRLSYGASMAEYRSGGPITAANTTSAAAAAATTAAATAATASAGANSQAPNYEGGGYGVGWEAVPRHHHPTRLSDVLEEDERSRTSPSRASQGSRGIR